jgi:protoporphyrin/coproporphyrin ferrochelatase
MITGVLLLNLGGPDSLQAVRPFLYNLFSDRDIIRLGPAFLQKPLAWLISTLRSKKTSGMYGLIGGKSPIIEITQAQAKALEESLNEQQTVSFKVYTGMRYWRPFIEDVITAIHRDGIKKVIVLSLYPQYSVTTSGSSISQVKKVLPDYPIDVDCVSSWHNHPLYIEALVDVIEKGIKSFSPSANEVHVLFSAHSLPQKIIDEGDPYVTETVGTINEIIKSLPVKWSLSYQSKSGPVKWLEPSTEEMLEKLAGEGIKNLLVVPISFVSDHIETLYEIDILYKKMATGLGINLKRSESLNTHPKFIDALRDIVMTRVREKGWA